MYSVIVCGDPSLGDPLVRQYKRYEEHFGREMAFYRAEDDSQQRVLFKARDLAEFLKCDPSRVCYAVPAFVVE
jgi:hypothetical protein